MFLNISLWRGGNSGPGYVCGRSKAERQTDTHYPPVITSRLKHLTHTHTGQKRVNVTIVTIWRWPTMVGIVMVTVDWSEQCRHTHTHFLCDCKEP